MFLNFAGIDLGTTYTKTHTGLVFPSGISETVCLSNNILEIDGKKYTMELLNDKSEYEINMNKGLNKNTRLNFIYALFKIANTFNFDLEDVVFENVIVGLPASQWKNENTVQQYKEFLALSEDTLVKVNNQRKRIQTIEIDVTPEGATAYYAINYTKFNGRKVLLLDWGGLTLNQILFENDEIIDLHTDEFGILKVYKDMAEKITTETGLNIKHEDMFDILRNGLPGKGQNTSVIEIVRDVANTHCKKVYNNLKLKWSIDTIPYVIMVGAGSITMAQYLKYYIPHLELQENPQILAAIGMEEMAGIKT